MVEQQQFAGNDNTGAQMQTAEAGGISGGDRMALYQDMKTIGGQTSSNEKSFSEQSMKESGKSTLEFDDIYSKEASQFSKDGSGQQGTQDGPGAGQQSDSTESANQKNGVDGQQSAKDGKSDFGSGGTDYNGKKEPYTKEALEGRQDFSPGGSSSGHDGQNQSNEMRQEGRTADGTEQQRGEKTYEGGHPGAPKNSDGTPMQPGEVRDEERRAGATAGTDQEDGLQRDGAGSGISDHQSDSSVSSGDTKPMQPKEQRSSTNDKSDKLEAQEDLDNKSNAHKQSIDGENLEAQQDLDKSKDSEDVGEKKDQHHDDKSGQHEQDWDKQQKDAGEKAKAESGEDNLQKPTEQDNWKSSREGTEPKLRQEGNDAAEKQNWSNTRKPVEI